MAPASNANRHSYQSHAAASSGSDLLEMAHRYEPTSLGRVFASYSVPSSNRFSVSSSYLMERSTVGQDRGKYHREGMSPSSSSSPTAASTTRTTGSVLDRGARGISHPSSFAWRRSFLTGRGTPPSFAAITTAASSPTRQAYSNPFTEFETASSPWSTRASVCVALDPGGFEGMASSVKTNAYEHSSAPTAAMNEWGNNSFLTGEEGKEILSKMSALSPSSYIRRSHRELEHGGDGTHSQRHDRLVRQHQVNASRPSSSEEVSLTTHGLTPFSIFIGRLRREGERYNQREDHLSRQVNTFGRGETTAHRFSTSSATTASMMEPSLTNTHFISLSAANYGVGTGSDLAQRNRRHMCSVCTRKNASAGRRQG